VASSTRFSPDIDTAPVPTRSNNRRWVVTAVVALVIFSLAVIGATFSTSATSIPAR
jgi:hypothetical protein